jgi:hypothetical protein
MTAATQAFFFTAGATLPQAAAQQLRKQMHSTDYCIPYTADKRTLLCSPGQHLLAVNAATQPDDAHYTLLSRAPTASPAVLTWATAMPHSTVLAIAQRYGLTVPLSTLLGALQAQSKVSICTSLPNRQLLQYMRFNTYKAAASVSMLQYLKASCLGVYASSPKRQILQYAQP